MIPLGSDDEVKYINVMEAQLKNKTCLKVAARNINI